MGDERYFCSPLGAIVYLEGEFSDKCIVSDWLGHRASHDGIHTIPCDYEAGILNAIS
jgi:hypothetical protein